MRAPNDLRRARVNVAVAFLTHAAVSGSLGPRIPDLRDRAGLDESGLGLVLMGYAVGLLVGTRVAGPLLRRLGSRALLRPLMPLLCASFVLVGLPRGLLPLALALGALGLVSGLLDVAMNTQAVAVERGYGRPLMSGIHGLWSGGMLAGGVVGATAAGLGLTPLAHFALVGSLLASLAVGGLRGLLPQDAEEFTPAPAGSAASDRTLRWNSVLLLCVIGFSSLFGEGAAADWSAVYLRDGLSASPATAALGFVAFALGMTISRFVGDRLWSVRGPRWILRACGLLAAGSLALGLLVSDRVVAIVAFGFFGFALGPIAPIVFSTAGNTWVRGRESALPLVVTVSYLGSILGPILIGFVGDRLDLRRALWIPAAMGLVIVAASVGLTHTNPGYRPPDP